MTKSHGPIKSKANPIPFKFKKPLAKFLRSEAKRTGKTMVRIVEELLEYRMSLKEGVR